MPPKKSKPNKPCPCGSGKKHKKCCMMKDQMTAGAHGGNGRRGTTARIPSAVAASTQIIENPPDKFSTLEYLRAKLSPRNLVMLKDGSCSHPINTIWPANVQLISDNNILARSYQNEEKNKDPGLNEYIVAKILARWRLVAFNYATVGRESGFFEVHNPAAAMHRFLSSVVLKAPALEAGTGMNTNGNSGTKIIAEADLSRILLLLESEEEDGVQRFRAGGSSHACSGGNRKTPSNNLENENEDKKGTTAVTSSSTGTDDDDNGGGSTGYTTKKYPRTPSPNNNSENENEDKKGTTAVTSSSTGTDDDDNGGGSTGYTTKKYLRTPSSSPLPVTSSTVTTGNATENVAAATLPFPSLSLMTLSEAQTEDAALIAMTTASPPLPPAGAAAAKLPPPPPQQQPAMLDKQEECVLCAYPLPLKDNESFYYSCCGETICNGCIIGQDRVLVVGTNVELPIKGSKEEKREFLKSLLSEVPLPCPFCRAEVPTNTEESSERLLKRINKYKDPEAMVSMGFDYMKGEHGQTKNLAKAEELFKQAYDLGCPRAAYFLVRLYSENIPDQARKMKYLEEGVRRGHPGCMLEMAGCEVESGNFEVVVQLTMIAAHLGEDDAIQHLMVCYQTELLSKDDLATTLRAHKAANDKVKSEPREYAKRRKDFKEKLIAKGNLRPK